jgi:hypothetical protein
MRVFLGIFIALLALWANQASATTSCSLDGSWIAYDNTTGFGANTTLEFGGSNSGDITESMTIVGTIDYFDGSCEITMKGKFNVVSAGSTFNEVLDSCTAKPTSNGTLVDPAGLCSCGNVNNGTGSNSTVTQTVDYAFTADCNTLYIYGGNDTTNEDVYYRQSGGGMSGWAIFFIIVGALAAVLLVVGAVLFLLRRRKREYQTLL